MAPGTVVYDAARSIFTVGSRKRFTILRVMVATIVVEVILQRRADPDLRGEGICGVGEIPTVVILFDIPHINFGRTFSGLPSE